MLVQCLGSSAHLFFCYCDSRTHWRRRNTLEAPDWHALARKPSARLSTRSVGPLYMSTSMTRSPGCYECCVPNIWPIGFLPFLNMRRPGRWAKVYIGGLEQGVPWPSMMFGCVCIALNVRPGFTWQNFVLFQWLHSFAKIVAAPFCIPSHPQFYSRPLLISPNEPSRPTELSFIMWLELLLYTVAYSLLWIQSP